MQTPLQVTFHGLPSSPALGEHIRRSAAALEGIFDRIVSCRVVVEAPHRHKHRGRLYRVRVDVGVPGAHLVIGHSPDDREEHADAHLAVRDAFVAATRRLEDWVRGRRDDVQKPRQPRPAPAAGRERLPITSASNQTDDRRFV